MENVYDVRHSSFSHFGSRGRVQTNGASIYMVESIRDATKTALAALW